MSEFTDYMEIEHVYAQTLGKGMKSLAIASPNSGDGCSTLACALAERHQLAGRKTLLVDMNFYRPSIDKRFDLTRLDWSSEKQSYQKALGHAPSGVALLPASRGKAMDFRTVENTNQLIRQWENEFDAIVIDTSPINSINRQNVPAELICSVAEAAIMVVRSGNTTEGDLLSATHKLRRLETALIGVVMNDVEQPRLADELIREAKRLDKWLPRLSAWLIDKIRANHFLNIAI